MSCFRRIGVLGILLAATIAAGQNCIAVVPAKFAAAPGEVLALSLRDPGGPEAAVAWEDGRIAWSLIRIAGTQENSDRAPRADENAAPGTVRLAAAGAAVIGVDFKPRIVQMDAAALGESISQSGRKAGTPEPKASAGGSAVRVVSSAKAIIRSGASEPGQSPTVTGKTGQQVELRPSFDPTGIGIGSDIPIVVYAGDGKAPGAKLIATHVATGEKREFIANDSAIGSFRLSRAGEWRVELRHLVEAKEKKEGEPAWVLFTATLTFEARERANGEGKQ